MKCPNCLKNISDILVAKYLASKGGAKSKRSISEEAQAKMQEGRARKRSIGNSLKF